MTQNKISKLLQTANLIRNQSFGVMMITKFIPFLGVQAEL